jgi:hypothetical protein
LTSQGNFYIQFQEFLCKIIIKCSGSENQSKEEIKPGEAIQGGKESTARNGRSARQELVKKDMEKN